MGNVIATKRPNEILIIGGKKSFGNSKTVWLYNL